MAFRYLFLLSLIIFGSVHSSEAGTTPAPVAVEPMIWNPPGDQQIKARSVETLRSDIRHAQGSGLIDLGKPPLQAKSEQESGPRQIGFARDIGQLKSKSDTSSQFNWQPLNGGLVGSFAVQSTGAAALRLGIRVEAIPDLAEVRFFSKDAAEVQLVSGKEISETIKRNLDAGDPEDLARMFWSPIISGELAGIEIFLPAGISEGSLQISLPQISHLYELPTQSVLQEPKAASASCELDAMCYPSWSATSKAVGQMTYISSGSSWSCTGTLLNDKASDGIPYFLTANHCINTQSSASSLSINWFYYSSACNSGTLNPTAITSSGGATLLYNSTTTDASFLKLNSAPPTRRYFCRMVYCKSSNQFSSNRAA